MTLSNASLVFEGLVAVLLAVTIFFAIKLNRRISLLREREADMLRMIDRFDQAAARAEASASHLKHIGEDTEKSLRTCVDRAQALRDELAFMVERADGAADKLDRGIAAESPVRSDRPASPRPVASPAHHPASAMPDDFDFGDDDPVDPDTDMGSKSERELVKALLSAQSEQDGT